MKVVNPQLSEVYSFFYLRETLLFSVLLICVITRTYKASSLRDICNYDVATQVHNYVTVNTFGKFRCPCSCPCPYSCVSVCVTVTVSCPYCLWPCPCPCSACSWTGNMDIDMAIPFNCRGDTKSCENNESKDRSRVTFNGKSPFILLKPLKMVLYFLRDGCPFKIQCKKLAYLSWTARIEWA